MPDLRRLECARVRNSGRRIVIARVWIMKWRRSTFQTLHRDSLSNARTNRRLKTFSGTYWMTHHTSSRGNCSNKDRFSIGGSCWESDDIILKYVRISRQFEKKTRMPKWLLREKVTKTRCVSQSSYHFSLVTIISDSGRDIYNPVDYCLLVFLQFIFARVSLSNKKCLTMRSASHPLVFLHNKRRGELMHNKITHCCYVNSTEYRYCTSLWIPRQFTWLPLIPRAARCSKTCHGSSFGLLRNMHPSRFSRFDWYGSTSTDKNILRSTPTHFCYFSRGVCVRIWNM